MSIRAMTWVWENSTAKGNALLLLLAIADNADDYGRARRSATTLSKKTRLSRRTVQRLIDQLAAAGHLTVQEGGGRNSSTYTLIMDPNQGAAHASGPHNGPTTAPESPSSTSHQEAAQKHQNDPGVSTTGVNLTQGQTDTGDETMSPQQRHSRDAAGVTQLCHPIRPIPVLDPSTGQARPADVDDSGDAGGGGGEHQAEPQPSNAKVAELASEVLDSLGAAWRLGKTSRLRLQEPLRQALTAGWSPQPLAAHLGANPDGVRNPYAVLNARLADLPRPPAQPKPWLAWCGSCDPDTRLIECDGDRVAHCPSCHPKNSKP